MKIRVRHRWNLTYREAVALQDSLRDRVRMRPMALRSIRRVAGSDIAIDTSRGRLYACAVVMAFPSLELLETRTVASPLTFPYIPGLLSFREIPGLIACFAKVRSSVDVILCDGQGIAHPRAFGLASHLGLLLGKPTIGCAKSLLVGEFSAVGAERGAFSALTYEGRRVGSVVRTRAGVKPLIVSPGHLIDQASSRRIVVACAPKYRLPEPTRLADRLAGEAKRDRKTPPPVPSRSSKTRGER
jgi:deoxyribonuclease V